MTILACDMGGTRIKLGLVRQGRILIRETIPAHSDRPLAECLQAVAVCGRSLCERAGVDLRRLGGMTIAFPSLIDVASARVLDEHGKYSDAPGFDLRGWAASTMGLRLAVDNDARMALIGEWRCGAGRGSDNVLMITLGTGLGTSVVIEGRVLRGRHGQAGCLGGHVTVDFDGRACQCGNIGCAEAQASTSVLREMALATPGFDSSPLAKADPLDYAAVFRFASEGDPCAVELRNKSLRVWAAMCVSLVHAYDPEILVLGGGIMASGEIILPFVRDYVRKRARTPWGTVSVVASELGDAAALLGGEYLLSEQFPPT